ncbi:MAG: OsmC family protein [Kiloniellaceae bacterium]
MPEISIKLRSVPDTAAAIGWSGPHSLTVDRPPGVARGGGLGFNGGELLALAIGGCFCNDLHYVATAQGIELTSLSVDVTLELSGDPPLATAARMAVNATAAEAEADIQAVITQAKATSTVSNSLARGLAVEVARV